MFRGDLHIHSCYSYDSFQKPEKIVRTALNRGLDFIAVTDHGSVRGGIETAFAAKGTRLTVIPGMEVKSDRGDIIGLFLHENIRSREAFQVIDEIHGQGGLAVLPHPYKKQIRYNRDEIHKFDAIEINARLKQDRNDQARILARECNKPLIGVSDAHFYWEIGNGLTYMDSVEPSADIFMVQIRDAQVKNGNLVNTLASYFFGKMRKGLRQES